MEMEASAVARRAERPAEVRMIGFRAEPEPRPLVVNVAAGGGDVGSGGGGDADECKLDGFARHGRAE